MKYMPARPNPSPNSSVTSLPVRIRPSIEVTPEAGFANDTSSEGDVSLTPRTEEGQPQRRARTPRSMSSLNGDGTRDASRHSQFDHDPMDYRMDDTLAHMYPAPSDVGHISPSSHRASTASSPRQEVGVAPSSFGQQIKVPEYPDPSLRRVIVAEPPSPQQPQAQVLENLESS